MAAEPSKHLCGFLKDVLYYEKEKIKEAMLMTTLLIGSIDTKQEVEAVLAVLRSRSHLSQKAVITHAQIEGFLKELREQRSNQIIGVVDTPREIKILLDILMKNEVLSGPVDTPVEIKIFMEKLQQEVVSQLCHVKAGQKITPDNKNRNESFPRP